MAARRRLREVARCCSTVARAPVAAVVAPGNCVFGEAWVAAPLLARKAVAHDSISLTFGLADRAASLGLSTCACLLAKGGVGSDGEPVVRPYTPTSTNAQLGSFELIVKVYPDGVLSQAMAALSIGSNDIKFKHVAPNVKVQYPFGAKHVAMLVGGTGITPMLQALHAILGTEDDTTTVSLLCGNKTEEDILLRATLDGWAAQFPARLRVTHVLSDAPHSSEWRGAHGFIDADAIRAHVPPPADSPLIFVCGPPPMYAALCGARDDAALTGTLAELGYAAERVVKF